MKLAPRYCRSCGSRLLVRNACHNCTQDPLKGNAYCYDCGSFTPQGTNCTNCGAKFNKRFPVIYTILIIIITLATIAVVGMPIWSDFSSRGTASTADTVKEQSKAASPQVHSNPVTNPAVTDTTHKTVPVADSSKKPEVQAFTSEELSAYKGRCSYFTKKPKYQVLFVTLKTMAYIKINNSIIELTRKHKGSNVSTYSGNNYEVDLLIDGLSGSDTEWLASCTLTVKDLPGNQSLKFKIYSTCIAL